MSRLFSSPDRRPRVAVLTSTYARSHDDHQVPWMREMARRTAGACELSIFAAGFRGMGSHEIDGIPVRRLRYAPARWEVLTHDEGAPNKARSLGFKLLVLPYILLGALHAFLGCLRGRIQVLHVHWPFPHGLWALLPKWLLGVRVVSMCHGAELALARNSGVIRKVLTFLLRQSDEICVNSSHTRSEVKRLCGLDARVVPYGATVPDNAAAPAVKRDKPLLLFCGRLVQRKGIDVLLRALPAILAEREVEVVITGEGDRKQEWQELSAELGLEDTVRFAGFVSNEELGELYRGCSLYVHPAIHDDKGDTEGLGVVLIEALANRKPVVASAVGGIVDVILDGETGLLVPEKDPAALAAAVLRVLGDEDLAGRLGEQGREHALRVFDWDRCASLTLGVYRVPRSAGSPALLPWLARRAALAGTMAVALVVGQRAAVASAAGARAGLPATTSTIAAVVGQGERGVSSGLPAAGARDDAPGHGDFPTSAWPLRQPAGEGGSPCSGVFVPATVATSDTARMFDGLGATNQAQ